jgi:hypothetical protein
MHNHNSNHNHNANINDGNDIGFNYSGIRNNHHRCLRCVQRG